jgi:hypothetical protein
MTFLPVMIFSLLFSLYGIIAKRLKWIYWLNSMNNVIPTERRAKIDWEGYSNVMGNIVSISAFILVSGWILLKEFGVIKYFPIVLLLFLTLMVWGQYGYSYRKFDYQLYSDLQQEKMKIKTLEYYNLDFVITALTIILAGLKYLIVK